MAKLVPIIVIVAVIIAGGAYLTLGKKNQGSTTPPNSGIVAAEPLVPVTPSAGITVSPATSGTSTLSHKDGTYTAIGSYQTPGDEDSGGAVTESISVTLTLKDGIVVDSTLEKKAKDQKSVLYQGVFAANYKTFVVGKKLTDIKVGIVSGSSLTGKGFNAAVAAIAIQAKA